MDIQFWVHKDSWIYIGNETDGARPATEDEIDTHKNSSNTFESTILTYIN
ncbi:hypothetical protein [Pectobacterium carotovorum]|nr:hypothetical protein [Pectobacterium carotovorum]MBB1528441.1 hypothetical protein [Pectobacterium carotovorum subsp. carotovorum]MCA6972325.1 hypothetical protein [Pectobacterium carotovorum]MCH4998803.1 hypothetical protein [Pectobacterium carotovorum]MDY4372159.1 hypothetical protein [Pectobacterium carotovorum subsp. carotovorum]